MIMKKVLLIAAMVAAVMPAMAQQTKYSVSGISSDNGRMVYLTNQNNSQFLDSTVVANGKFAFAGAVDKDALLSVRVKNVDWETSFFNDGTPITINMNDSTVKGSALNEKLNAYDLQMNQPLKDFRARLAGMSETEIKEHAEELNKEMDKLLSEYSPGNTRILHFKSVKAPELLLHPACHISARYIYK